MLKNFLKNVGLLNSLPKDENYQRYYREFIQAYHLPRELGFPQTRVFKATGEKILIGGIELKLQKAIVDFVETLGNEVQISANCLFLTLSFFEYLNEHLPLNSFVTLGYVNIAGNDWFKFSQDDLRRWVIEGLDSPENLNMHAWLTLPSMEIIDLTLSSTIAEITGDRTIFGRVMTNAPQDSPSIKYHPIALGTEVIKAMHRKFAYAI